MSLLFRGKAYQQVNWSDTQKLHYSMKLHEELHRNYMLISKMTCVCIEKGLKLVIENPASLPHYLHSYWCIEPSIVDNNRRINGDYQKKPTQYWFIGFKPKQNILIEPIEYVEYRTHNGARTVDGIGRTTMRSMIHPQYANRFIRMYLLDELEENHEDQEF